MQSIRGSKAGAVSRGLLDSLSKTDEDARPVAVCLHWAMAHLKAQWAAVHERSATDDSKMRLVASTSASAVGQQTLFDFLGDEVRRERGVKLPGVRPAFS